MSWDPTHSYQTPTLYNWNLGIERQFLSSILVRAAYVGSHASYLKETIAFNVSPVGGGTPRLNAIAGPNVFGTTNNGPTQDSQDINSFYHSLQLSAEKRMSRGLTILGSYTWSKSIDDLPNGGGVADIGAILFPRGPGTIRCVTSSTVGPRTLTTLIGLLVLTCGSSQACRDVAGSCTKSSAVGSLVASSRRRPAGRSLFYLEGTDPARELGRTGQR